MKTIKLSLMLVAILGALQFTLRCWAEEPTNSSFTSKIFGRGDKSAKNSQLLPPAEAAKACVSTADEMAKGGYRKEAILLYERARQLDSGQKHVCRYLAVLYDEEGDDAKALTEYAAALKLTPKDADLLNDFGYYYFSRGDLTKAEHWFRAALAQSPKHERAWVNLGMVLGQAGRYQESYEAFCKVVNPAAANSNVGMLLAKNGQRDDAVRAFQQSLVQDPNLKPPRTALTYFESCQNPAAASVAPLTQQLPSASAQTDIDRSHF